MDIKEIKKLKVGKILENVDLKKYTTYKVGGTGKLLIIPDSEKKLVKLMKYIIKNNIKHMILGNGSNLIFSDDVYDGILIKLDLFDKIKIENNLITVGAGYNMIKLSLVAARHGLAGLEFASGVPGTVGGAVYMNAGAYGSDMGYIVKSVRVINPSGDIEILDNKKMDYHYRSSLLKSNKGYICLEVTLKLRKGNSELILEVIRDRKKRRLETQPIEFPSAGSVFKNPDDPNWSSWKLVEDIGYKGKKIGGAMVSLKHSNFIINDGDAKSEDIKKLIKEIQTKVKEKHNIDLKLEQEIVE